jgi:hypothetical protein
VTGLELVDWPTAWGAPPLYATKRNRQLITDGPQVEIIARGLGTPLIPWQRYTTHVANERRDDGSYEYQVVIVSVPRQTGKTTVVRANGVHRCLVCGRDVFYTAQTGKDARARWMDLVKVLRVNDALADKVRVRLRGGSEHVEFPGGSVFQVFAPTPESLHGYTPPTVMVDEGFALDAMAGELLMGAIGPAQITITDKQIWIVSTAGTAESTWFHDWIDLAMEGTPRVAGFIWGARDDQDPYSLADIAAFHPGVGFELNGAVLEATAVLEQAGRNSRAEYERAYANRRTVTGAQEIPRDVWEALAPPDFEPPESPSKCVLVYEVAHDRQSAAIVAAWRHGPDQVRVKVVRAQAGVRWLVPAIRELRASWRPTAVAAAGSGPAVEVTEQLDHVDVLSERDYAAASGAFLTSIDAGTLEHDGDPTLTGSVTGLVTRPTGDGVALSRRLSVGDSSPGIAAALAAHVIRRRRATVPIAIPFGGAA